MKIKNLKFNGFTLVELLVSVAIFVTITTVVLVRHSQFSGTILVENLAYDIALSVRKAQVFGLSIKESSTGFNAGYGVHFDEDSNNSYIFFVDKPELVTGVGNQKYDGSSEKIETLTLKGGNTISKFCALSGETQKCSPSITYLDIIFERPNPEAIIKSNNDTYSSAKITISSPQGMQWNIEVTETGQISVQK